MLFYFLKQTVSPFFGVKSNEKKRRDDRDASAYLFKSGH